MKGAERPPLAFAQARERAAGQLIGGSHLPAEAQVAMLKGLCRHLWGLLDKRAALPGGAAGVNLGEEWASLSVDAKAACDRAFEASLILLARDGSYVEPCRRPLFGMDEGVLRYVLTPPHGSPIVVTEEQLLIMAGIVQ